LSKTEKISAAPYNSPQRKLLLGFGIAIILVIIISILTSYYTERVLAANEWVEHTKSVIAESELTISAAKDLVLRNQGYVITGNPTTLEQFNTTSKDVFKHIQQLRKLTGDNALQQKRIDSLSYFIQQRIEFSILVNTTKDKFGTDSAIALIAGKQNKRYLNDIRAITAAIQKSENDLLVGREKENAEIVTLFKGILFALLASVFSLLIFVFLTVRYAFAARDAAEQKTMQLNAVLEQKVIDRTEEIRKNNQLFKALVENTYDMVSLADETFKVTYRSPAAYRLTGWTMKEMQEMDGTAMLHPDDAPAMKQLVHTVLSNPKVSVPFSFRFPHKAGHYLWVEGTMTNLLHDKSINGIVINTRDVTASKQAEDLLRMSEGRLSAIIEQFPLPIITYNADGLVMGTNKAWEIMWEDKFENVMDYNIRQDPQMKAAGLDKYVEQAYAGNVAQSEPYEYDPALIGKIGRKRWMQMLLFPYKGKQGEVLEVVVVLQDVTFNIEANAQIQKLNNELELKVLDRTRKLEAANKELEAFSYSVSHDLRAPLRAVNGFARILKEDYSKVLDEEGIRLLNVIRENAQKMGLLIDDLLAFSRLGRQEIKKTKVDMADVFSSALKDITKNVVHKAEVKIAPLPSVMADSSLMGPVVINLLSNAIKYSSTKDNPLVEVSCSLQNGEYVFKIQDNGVGFEMEYVHKLFGVFQRLHTADEFEGTGVGLAIVERIVKKHNGRVWAEAEVDKGATFYFTLPDICIT
jgi:PAS domain S-box-containing protein